MPIRETRNQGRAWQDLQVANRELQKRDRMAITPRRAQRLQDLYERRGGPNNLDSQERLILDRRAMAQASSEWVDANRSRMAQNLGQCSSAPSGMACRNGRAMQALEQAAERYMGS